MNAALHPPVDAGTAPHNEVTAMQRDDNGQRDDREATMPREDIAPPTAQLPPGFRWMPKRDASGRPVLDRRGNTVMTVKPTLENIRDLTDLVTEFFEARDVREDEVGDDAQLKKLLDKLQQNLGKANQYLGGAGPAYSLAGGYAQQLANAVRWVDIHAQQIQRHQANGNQDGADQSLINLESSRTQALKVASLLDWCEDAGATINIQWGVTQALNLAAWSIENAQQGQHRRAVQTTTRNYLYNTPTSTPEEEAEATKE